MAAGADLQRVHIITAVCTADGKGRRGFNLQTDLELLERKVAEIGDLRMILIDPISSYIGPKIDSHVNAAVRGVLEPVSEFAARLKIAVVAITHPPKGVDTNAVGSYFEPLACNFGNLAVNAHFLAMSPSTFLRDRCLATSGISPTETLFSMGGLNGALVVLP
jgi:hypothetical protein